ncbi:MAG TPA: hypothetical protein VN659_03815, partial [Pyrinomonadaceae bacterium]|nr:hypothetical protein [Pyrinomonadaceae bacterium]
VVGLKVKDFQVSPFFRTAIRVQQHVVGVAGGLTSIEFARATIEPRLLDVDNLSHLALLDPALVLARKHPNETITVLIDALDEVIGKAGGSTILDWLQTVELSSNIRFVLSSRPNDRLRNLESVRGDALEVVHLDAESPQVAADVRVFVTDLFAETQALAGAPEPNKMVDSLARAAQGNFAYLTAYARALRAAIATEDKEQLKELLAFESLPSGLLQLYAAFARRMRQQIDALGQLEIASPRGAGDEFTPAWEGVGQRLLGVLTVAFAPLSLKQLMALGSIRVWESNARNVLQTLRPFLDETSAGWKLFHPSLAEFLTTADEHDAGDVAVNAPEWHSRIVRYYKGSASWATLDWRKTDSYGLLHVVDHITAGGNDPAAAIELVTANLRNASRERFITDLPFQRMVQSTRERLTDAGTIADVLTHGLFLQLVLSGLGRSAGSLGPAVYGLLARLGRVEEALARADVLEPGLRKYRTFEAICQSTPAGLRDKLGPLDGVERLVGAAVEVPVTAGPIVGGLGYDLATCLHDAAVAMVPHDVNRAMQLAELGDKYARFDKAIDAVYAAIAALTPEKALESLQRMQAKRLQAAVEAAERATPGPVRDEIVAFAMAHLDDDKESFSDPLPFLARLFALLEDSNHADQRAILRARFEEAIAANSNEEASSNLWGLSRVAETLHDTDAELAERLLKSFESHKVDSLVADGLVQAARLWALWGHADKARVLLNQALAAYRALGWYGPARDIARAARVAASFDPEWSETLADEAMALLETAVRESDDAEWDRLDSIISGTVESFRHGDRARALKVARWSRGDWIHGGSWDSTDGTGGIAILGLDLAAEDPKAAEQLLTECLRQAQEDVRLGRSDPRVVHSGFFKPADENKARPGTMEVGMAAASMANYLNYWHNGRDWRFFRDPVDVLRSIDAVFPATSSWARAIAAAVQPVAQIDLDRAFNLISWPADPCERLVALAAFAGVCDAADPRSSAVLAAISSLLTELPEYEPPVDLKSSPAGAFLGYLNPALRARFEAALIMPPHGGPSRMLPPPDQNTFYLHLTYDAEVLFNGLLGGTFSGYEPEELSKQLDQATDRYGQSDPLFKDLLEVAATYALALKDPALGSRRIDRIQNPALKVTAKLTLPNDSAKTSAATQMLSVLKAAGDDVSPLHRAELAATAVLMCLSIGQTGDEILEWGVGQLEAADPLMTTRGLTSLAPLTSPEQQPDLLSRALSASENIGNRYIRGDAVADLLGPVTAAGNSSLVVKCLDQLLEEGWTTFTNALSRAMPAIVQRTGVEIVEGIDSALRNAQHVLSRSDKEPEHFDGVWSDEQRKQAATSLLDAQRAIELYLSTYLDHTDIANLPWVQDSRLNSPDPGDEAFTRLHGSLTGLSAWQTDMDQTVWRLVDIRFVFDDAEQASAYHHDRLKVNSEGYPPIEGAPAVGEECFVFGGTQSNEMGGISFSLTAYFYIFRVGRVVAKLFAAQGPQAKEPLTPEALVPLAQRIVQRIQDAGFA